MDTRRWLLLGGFAVLCCVMLQASGGQAVQDPALGDDATHTHEAAPVVGRYQMTIAARGGPHGSSIIVIDTATGQVWENRTYAQWASLGTPAIDATGAAAEDSTGDQEPQERD